MSTSIPTETPWGHPDRVTEFAPGIIFLSTPSHGGFWLAPDRNAEIPACLRQVAGWYEEDCDWAAVAYSFPQHFSAEQCAIAERSLKDWQPSAYEILTGVTIPPGESLMKDRAAFELRHAGDWVVISAITSGHRAGMVEVFATLGGRRSTGIAARRYLVPADEYSKAGRHGFVIGPDLPVYEGPTSFAGGQQT